APNGTILRNPWNGLPGVQQLISELTPSLLFACWLFACYRLGPEHVAQNFNEERRILCQEPMQHLWFARVRQKGKVGVLSTCNFHRRSIGPCSKHLENSLCPVGQGAHICARFHLFERLIQKT